MREVCVVGVGMTKFGKFLDKEPPWLAEEAVYKAVTDAGISHKDIEIAYVGNVGAGAFCKQGFTILGEVVLAPTGLCGIPITSVSNACASASAAFREAVLAVASGYHDVALALGVEKMQMDRQELLMDERRRAKVMGMGGNGADAELEGQFGISFPGFFGMAANRHMKLYGTTPEHFAMVSVKNRTNAAKNPYAQFQKPITTSEVLESRMVAYPLTFLMCCPTTDGAAAAIVMSKEKAEKVCSKPVLVAGCSLKTATFEPNEHDLDTMRPTIRAGREACQQAGIEPNDIDLALVHDCFSISEMIHYEDLGFCEKGDSKLMVERGETEIGGRIPVNPCGGLLSKGHPVGATGVAQVCEVTWQLRGEAGDRQVEDAEIGLTHTLGGTSRAEGVACGVNVLKRGW
jgi:acetyl-CoA acetyltransferase